MSESKKKAPDTEAKTLSEKELDDVAGGMIVLNPNLQAKTTVQTAPALPVKGIIDL